MVIVPQNVADAGDCTPRDVRLIFLQLLGKAAAGLGQNLEISFNKLPRAPVRAKLLEVIPRRIRLDVRNGLENVMDIDSPSEHGFGLATDTIPDGGIETLFRYDIDPVSERILQEILH